MLARSRADADDKVGFRSDRREPSTGAAQVADAVAALEPPNAFLVQEVLAAQGTDWAEVDNITRQFVIARLAREYFDFFHATATDHMQFAGAADFARKAHTAGTHHTAVGKQGDLLADMVLVDALDFGFIQAAVGFANL